MSMVKEYYLAGKEYFDEAEACHYCCVSQTKFRADVMPLIPPRNFLGKRVFRRSELKELLDQSPEWKKKQ